MLESIKRFLSGKKTYIAAAGIIISGINQFIEGEAGAVMTILQGLSLLFLRQGVAKTEPKADSSAGPRTARAFGKQNARKRQV